MTFDEAEIKARRVITSCITQDQLVCAQEYTLLFFNKYRDYYLFRELIDLLNDKIDELSNSPNH